MKKLLTLLLIATYTVCNAQIYVEGTDVTDYVNSLKTQIETIPTLNSRIIALTQANDYQSVTIATLTKELENCVQPVSSVVDFENTTLSTAFDKLKTPFVEYFALNYQGSSSYAHGEIITDPTNSSNKVLFGEVHDDDPSTTSISRFNAAVKFKDNNYKTFRVSYDVLWNSDIQKMETTSQSLSWFNILEFWEASSGSVGNVNGQAMFSLRWTRNLSGGKIYWRFSATKQQPVQNVNIWPNVYNRDVPIPWGEWARLSVEFVRGQGTNGRIIVTITPRKTGITYTIFDIKNYTEYPVTPLYIAQLHFCKLYSSDAIYDFYRGKGWEISAMYDNLKIEFE